MISLLKEKRTRLRKPTLPPAPTPEKLFTEVCHVMAIDEELVKGGRSFKELVKVRAVYYYLGRGFGFGISEMGRVVGRTHATVLHQLGDYDDYLDKSRPYYDAGLANEISGIKHRLRMRLINCR